ncbi:MAG: hypothetical protein AABX66_02110 [Nanoarchaeota archaeon]
MIRAKENLIGAYAFLIGLVLAVIVGVLAGLFIEIKITPLILGILALLGILVGFFVADNDIQTFLMASVSLVLVSYLGISGLLVGAAFSGIEVGHIISSVLQTLLAMFVPATIVVALKSVFSIASS